MDIAVWGGLRVSAGEGRVLGARDFPGVKPKQLLEILVAERGHLVSKSRLADLVWADRPPAKYLATLETYVSVMRQTLQPGVSARASVVQTEHGGYRLDTDRTTIDLEAFDQLVRSAAGLPPVTALATLTTALELVRGPVLEDEPDAGWADQLRSSYQQKQVQVLIDAGRLSLITGETTGALALAERAVALDPLAEAGYQVLMTACYSLWRQEDALRAFDRCRTLLADELGVDPMDETVALHLGILRHEDISALMPRTPSTTPSTTASPAASTTASTAASTAGPAGTPALALLGRHTELGQLRDAVNHALTGQFTLALIHGEPGIGKTRLADALIAHSTVRVGTNRCSDMEAELPYVALSLALRTVLPSTPDGPMPVITDLLRRDELAQPFDHFARMRVMESLATIIEDHSPFLLVLDDAHWADPDTLTTLSYLRRRCPTTPVTIVLTCDRGSHSEALRKLNPDLRIDLTELTPTDLAPLGAHAHPATDGHPLFLTDWLHAQHQNLPDTFTPALRERIITRCWDLGPHAYRLLTVASLLPQPFNPTLLSHLVGTTDDITEDLDQRVQDHLLTPDGDNFRFRHTLVRTILAETFSAARRTHLLNRAHNHTQGSTHRRHTDTAPRRRYDDEHPLTVIIGA